MEALLGIALLATTIACLQWLAPRPGREPHWFMKHGMDTAVAVLITAVFALGIGLTIEGAAELWQDSAVLRAALD